MADARARFEALRPGERLLYASGPALIRGATADLVRRLYEAGEAHLWQKRRRDGSGFDFLAEKAGQAPLRKPFADPATRRILGALLRAARHGRPCPSNAELARIAGLPTRAQAQWRFDKLREGNLIRSETVTGNGPIARVVTIVRTGRSTRRPTALTLPPLRGGPLPLPHGGEGRQSADGRGGQDGGS